MNLSCDVTNVIVLKGIYFIKSHATYTVKVVLPHVRQTKVLSKSATYTIF